MMGWVAMALGVDGGLAKSVRVGDRVEHRGTKQWGLVREIVPQADGTAELRVEGIKTREWEDTTERWWATYHIRGHERGVTPNA